MPWQQVTGEFRDGYNRKCEISDIETQLNFKALKYFTLMIMSHI